MINLLKSYNQAKWEKKKLSEMLINTVKIELNVSSDNKSSFWLYNEDIDELKDFILVLASTRDYLQKIDIIWIPKFDIEQCIQIEECYGNSPVNDMNNKHIDLVNLDDEKLMLLTKLMIKSIAEKKFKRFKKSEVLEILAEAAGNRLDVNSLRAGIQRKLKEKYPEIANTT